MAVYVPNPDGIPASELIELLGWELADRYEAAENVLLAAAAKHARRIINLEAKANVNTDLIQRQRELQLLATERIAALQELRRLAAETVTDLRDQNLADWLIDIAATEGEAAAAARLGLARRLPRAGTLSGTSTQAVGALLFDLTSKLEALHLRILRFPDDVYKQVISETAPRLLLGTENFVMNQRAAVQSFLARGVDGFVDRANRRWTIGSYSEMAARTASARAWNDAGTWRMQQSGINLVTVVGSFDACDRCAPWIGKVLSTNGQTGQVVVPHATQNRSVTVTITGTVQEARAAGWGHPNCRDQLAAFMPGLSIPMSDFQYDPAAEAERAKQRQLERDIRAAKRRESVAMDDIAAANAAKERREAQADMREFVKDTGRLRASYREQLHFADGRSPR